MEDLISGWFDQLERYMGFVIPNLFISATLRFIFSKTSVVVHTIWFAYWFLAGLNIGLLTNIVSLEAIYIGILIGIQQIKHHKSIKKHLEGVKRK